MKILTSTGRIIVFAIKNFTRNAWIGLATVTVLVLAILSVNVLIGASAISDAAVKMLEQKIDVSVYFKPDTPDAIVESARSYMASLPQTGEVRMQTKDEALAAFKERHKNDQSIMDALDQLDENPLGSTLTIKAKQTEDYPFLMDALQNPQFAFAIESKTYEDHATAINKVQDIAKSVSNFGILLIAVFSVFSLLIVYNAIRVAIYTQREEIGIMRLVGASNSFVRMPLILDGVLFALLAMLISAGIIAFTVIMLEPKLAIFFEGIDPGIRGSFVENALTYALVQGGVLIALVVAASWVAAGKYLKK